MIHIVNKQDCCGCASCVQSCPKQCIQLVEDEEGFLYPEVDQTICINCGLCEKVCPLLQCKQPLPSQRALAVKNRDEEERLASSSGGVFIALAKIILQQGGVVFGAVYDEHWEVKHSYAENLEGVKPMMGSKYLQSRTEHTYQETERFLKEGRKVLYVGSPCQIAALHAFLRKDYPNLLAVDFSCHGVPSPSVWRKYLDETFSVNSEKSSLNNVPVVSDIYFREKKTCGWKNFSFVVTSKVTSKTGKDSILLSNVHYKNPYMRGFLSDIYLRPSCYLCRSKNGVSHSDLTIADFWGINKIMPDFDDDKGVGLVLINSEKGSQYFSQLNMETRECDLSLAKTLNGGFEQKRKVHPKRANFYKQIQNGKTISQAVENCLKVSLPRKAVRLLKRIVRKGIKMCKL